MDDCVSINLFFFNFFVYILKSYLWNYKFILTAGDRKPRKFASELVYSLMSQI